MPRHDIAKILYEEAIGIMENTIEMWVCGIKLFPHLSIMIVE